MILDTKKWFEENKNNMTEEELHEADLFMMFGWRDHFFHGLCSCCGQYTDLELENVEKVDEKTGMMQLSYKCMPCWIKHKEPLTDEEFEKVKEEIPENVKECFIDDDEYNKKSSIVTNEIPVDLIINDDTDDFFKELCQEK